jgi:hypothetical protein
MVFLYNDAAISTLTVKHPSALGRPYRDVFKEAWDLVGADLEACFYRGETAVRDNMLIPILFNGVLEDHYWSYSLIQSEARLKLATEVAQLGVFVWETGEDRGSWENDRVHEIFRRSRDKGPSMGMSSCGISCIRISMRPFEKQ